jgi:nitrate/TMAO reductase-like tetraheme cytochrome c subunit
MFFSYITPGCFITILLDLPFELLRETGYYMHARMTGQTAVSCHSVNLFKKYSKPERYKLYCRYNCQTRQCYIPKEFFRTTPYPSIAFKSASGVLTGLISNFSTKTLRTLVEMKAGNVGPR